MRLVYNLFAGRNLDRLAALSDGVFSVGMTLLVLDLHAPVAALIHSERDLAKALASLAPRFIPYLMSFLTLGIFWVGQQVQLERFERSDRNLSWIHLGFLFAVTLVPFSTALLAEFLTFKLAIIAYWLNIVLLGAALYLSWNYAARAGLLKTDTTAEEGAAVRRRIVVAQALYALGAALCFVNTYASIVFFVLVQLNYVFAPRIWPLYRV